jgi:CHAT domain-containing protein
MQGNSIPGSNDARRQELVVEFLYDQATQLLRLLRWSASDILGPLDIPIPFEALFEQPFQPAPPRRNQVRGVEDDLRALRQALQEFRDGTAPVDWEQSAVIESLRLLLENIYQQPIVFKGMSRSAGSLQGGVAAAPPAPKPAPSPAPPLGAPGLGLDWMPRSGDVKAIDEPAVLAAGPENASADSKPIAPGLRVNVEVDEVPAGQPLRVDEEYALAVWLDDRVSAAHSVVFANERAFEQGEDQVELEVLLTSKNLTVLTSDPQRLRARRSGRSRNKVRFQIQPQRAGAAQATVVFFRNRNFVQAVMVTLGVGDLATQAILGVESLGRPPEAAFPLRRRDLSLFIRRTGQEYELMLVGPVAASATLRLSPEQVKNSAERARAALMDIVYLRSGPGNVVSVHPRHTRLPPGAQLDYQRAIDIPEQVHQAALKILAEAGQDLFDAIFNAPTADAQVKLLGAKLRELATADPMIIQIVSQEFPLPWGMLYLTDRFDPNDVDPARFLGFRHVIEQIPLQMNMAVTDPLIRSINPPLEVSINLNSQIDNDMRLSVVADQRTYWDGLQRNAGVHVVHRSTNEELLSALQDATTKDQIVYFFGHAAAASDPNDAYVMLSGNERLTLAAMRRGAAHTRFPGLPLVIMNACESAEMTPLFYDGFMPFFTQKGARGVIGTECEVPALFAAEWARRFFDAFLGGAKPLGTVLLEIRQEFLREHNNVLGLLYTTYCDGDTQIQTALSLARSEARP